MTEAGGNQGARHRGVLRRVAVALALWLIVLVVLRVAVAPAEACPVVNTDDVEAAADATVGWLARNQSADGDFVYRYDRVDDREVPDVYNLVRHAGVTSALEQAATRGSDEARRTADAAEGYALDHLVHEDDWAAFGRGGQELSTGASALLVAALVERREATEDERYDAELRALGRFLVAQTSADGAVSARWDPGTGAPAPDAFSKFFTGETAWALARLHSTFPDEGWDEPASRIVDYLATRRDDAEDWFPPIADHWAAYALAEVATWPERGGRLTDSEAAYARRLAGLFGVEVRWESQREGGGVTELVRGPDVRAGGVGTLGEGLTAIWRASRAEPALDDLRTPVAERSVCVAALLTSRQLTDAAADDYADPSAVAGAWFIGDETRMDDQQHSLSALLLALPVLDAETDGS